MTFTSISGDSLFYLQIVATLALLGAIWLAARSDRTRRRAEARPQDTPATASATLTDFAERLALLETQLKAEKRDREDFEESVRRWQGRVNRQSSRDDRAKGEVEREDDGQLDFAIPANGRTPQQRPPSRPVPLSQRFRRL